MNALEKHCTWLRVVLGVMLLVAASAVAAGAELAVGPAVEVTPRLAFADQRWPAVAAAKGCYLVVWQEGEAMAGVKDTGIFAARLGLDGKPLDAEPIAVCAAQGFQTYPAVAFDGRDFLVAWQDFRSGEDWDVYAARVSPEGKRLDAEGFAVATGAGNQIYPAMASDGNGCLLVWSDLRPQPDQPEGYALSGTLVVGGRPEQVNGQILVPHYDAKARGLRSVLTPAAVYDGTDFVVAAQCGPSGWKYGAPLLLRVARSGKVEPLAGGFLAPAFAVAADPAGHCTFVWSNQRTEHGSYQPRYLCSIFRHAEPQINQMALGLQTDFAPRNDLWCAAVYDGKGFVAVVEQVRHYATENSSHQPVQVVLVATRVDPATARPLDTGAQAAPANAWQDVRPFGKREKTPSNVRSGALVAAEPLQQRHPAMASAGGGKSLLVYQRHGGPGKYKIHAVTLSQ